MTPAGFRRAALGRPQTREASHMGHADFRVGARIFATLGYPDAAWGMVKLTPLQQSQLAAAFPRVFVPVRGAWGLRGATNVNLKAATPQCSPRGGTSRRAGTQRNRPHGRGERRRLAGERRGAGERSDDQDARAHSRCNRGP